MMRKFFTAVIFASFTLSFTACGSESDTVVYADPDSAALVQASEQARATLPKFLEMMASPPDGTSEYSLKVAVPAKDGSSEHIWMSDISVNGDEFTGIVNNDPKDVAGMKIGDRASFVKTDVSDWQFMKDEKLFGHYTTRTMLNLMNEEQRQLVESLLSETPL